MFYENVSKVPEHIRDCNVNVSKRKTTHSTVISERGLTLLDGDVSGVEGGDEGGLGQRVLEREELVLGDGVGAGLEHCLAADGREVGARDISESQLSTVVLSRVQAVGITFVHQLAFSGTPQI